MAKDMNMIRQARQQAMTSKGGQITGKRVLVYSRLLNLLTKRSNRILYRILTQMRGFVLCEQRDSKYK